MAKYGSASVGFFLAGGFNLLASKIFEISGPEKEALTEESHGLGDEWAEHLANGMMRGTISHSGLYDDAALGINEALAGQQDVERVVCLGFEGNTIGKKFTGMAGAFSAKFKRAASRAGLTKAGGDITVTGAIEEGVILQEFETKTADWDTEGAESVDNGASSANGGAAYQQVEAFTGFTGFIGKLRHSADDVTYADLATFTNVTSETTAQRVAIVGTINRHTAYKGDVTGTGSMKVMGGLHRAA